MTDVEKKDPSERRGRRSHWGKGACFELRIGNDLLQQSVQEEKVERVFQGGGENPTKKKSDRTEEPTVVEVDRTNVKGRKKISINGKEKKKRATVPQLTSNACNAPKRVEAGGGEKGHSRDGGQTCSDFSREKKRIVARKKGTEHGRQGKKTPVRISSKA